MEEDFESCTGCWYAEHGECSFGNEPCHAEALEKYFVEFGVKIGFLTPEKAEQLLKEHPQIVRCKDCEYLIDHYGFMNDGYCANMRDKYCVKFKPDKDWFCADGKRRGRSVKLE